MSAEPRDDASNTESPRAESPEDQRVFCQRREKFGDADANLHGS
jgi:hypothetical protein